MGELAPGFRFYPTEEELVCFYLRHKLDGRRRSDIERVIPVSDLCSLDPWQLPEAHRGALAGDGEPWFYFCPRQERETRGGRPSRTTPSGYWKAAGTPGWVFSAAGRPVGTKKTMVFYRGRAPAGAKTKWKLNEYRALDDDDLDAAAAASVPNLYLQTRSEFSLCRLYTRSGCPRQFDRRPCTSVASVGGEDPAPSTAAAAAASAREAAVEAGRDRKRKMPCAPNDETSSNDSGGDLSMQRPTQGGVDEELVDGDGDDMAGWEDILDWI